MSRRRRIQTLLIVGGLLASFALHALHVLSLPLLAGFIVRHGSDQDQAASGLALTLSVVLAVATLAALIQMYRRFRERVIIFHCRNRNR